MSALATRDRRSAAIAPGLAAIWLAGPVIAAYAVWADDWHPLLVLFPLMGVDHLVFRAWLGRQDTEHKRAIEYRGALVIRSVATVLTVAGFVAFVAVLPASPAAGAVAALVAVAAGGSFPHQLMLVLAPRMRVRVGKAERKRWLRWDRRVEIAGWAGLAALVAATLLGWR